MDYKLLSRKIKKENGDIMLFLFISLLLFSTFLCLNNFLNSFNSEKVPVTKRTHYYKYKNYPNRKRL